MIAMTTASPARRCPARVTANAPVSSGLLRLDLRLPAPMDFRPGQFAMLNLAGAAALVFGRPFSILAADGADLSFLYRVVGRGTQAMAGLTSGSDMTFLGPLGRPFPGPQADKPALLIAGGVGLPPLHAWWRRHGRPEDLAFFGAKDAPDVPWELLGEGWEVAVESVQELPPGRAAHGGLVTQAAFAAPGRPAGPDTMVLACGPWAMLKAVAELAGRAGADCWLSLEEHMGCGYGVCRGCAVPVRSGRGRDAAPAAGPQDWSFAMCCQDGPVFRASDLAWEQWDRPPAGGV